MSVGPAMGRQAPPDTRLAGAWPGPRARRPRSTSQRAVLAALPARLLAFAALSTFGALQWASLLERAASSALLACVAASVLGGALLAVVARRGGTLRVRAGAGLLAGVALLLVALVAAGVPAALLEPRGWGDLAAGVADGMRSLPTVRIPYSGLDEWSRIVLILGGGVLLATAAVLTFLPRAGGRFGHPAAGAVALGVLYAVPAVQRTVEHPFLAGLVFAVLLAALLWLERVEVRAAPAAIAVLAAAGVLGLVAAPRLDGAQPLLDYESIAESLAPSETRRYVWSHTYGPLDWPRDGREVLRIEARHRAYWKATDLETFDGRGWVEGGADRREGASSLRAARAHPQWQQTIRVSLRALRSGRFIGAGTTLDILRPPRAALSLSPGVFATPRDRPLRRGHAYRAVVYTPRPSAAAMRAAGTDYDAAGLTAGTMLLRGDPRTGPTATGGPGWLVAFPTWGGPGEATAFDAGGGTAPARAVLAASPHARTYALARRLRAIATTPYAFVLAVERHLRRGFSYSEQPPASTVPLADFLFRDRVGYCQQFSGAMALLLRMGGVPARVSAGFTSGSFDTRRGEYVVRDVDAHSWVEVYFPGIGWVTRDPTPPDSPARAQSSDAVRRSGDAPAALGGALEGPATRRPDGAAGASPEAAAAGDDGSVLTVSWLIGGAVLLGAGAMGTAVLVRRRRAWGPAGEPLLRELRRALARAGRPAAPEQTLHRLEARFEGTPGLEYLRALSQSRYGYGAAAPTRRQRAGLRRALGAGGGPLGRLRAWWALPPL